MYKILSRKLGDMKVAFEETYFADEWKRMTYCSIQIVKDGKFEYYHGGAVWNGKDKFNLRTAKFAAFKNAIKKRWEEKHIGVVSFEAYYKHWARTLAYMMDNNIIVLKDEEYVN